MGFGCFVDEVEVEDEDEDEDEVEVEVEVENEEQREEEEGEHFLHWGCPFVAAAVGRVDVDVGVDVVDASERIDVGEGDRPLDQKKAEKKGK